jgi:acyl-CoA synthetase (AMP-forming)/AMP-acid ligase II
MEVAVIGIPDDRWGEAVHAIVMMQPTGLLDVPALMAHCREKLADYKLPKSAEVRCDMPRSAAGKILKRMLRDEFWKESAIKV